MVTGWLKGSEYAHVFDTVDMRQHDKQRIKSLIDYYISENGDKAPLEEAFAMIDQL